MDTYKETFETWDKVAKLYEDKFMHIDLFNDTYDRFCDLIVKAIHLFSKSVAGPGNISRYLLHKRPDLILHGIDISPNMITLAKANNPSATFSVMDCREIHQLENRYDGIISGFCLPYLSEADVSKLMKDVKNLLEEDGVFYISYVPRNKSDSGFLTGSTGDRTYFYFHTPEFLSGELKANGFETITLFHKTFRRENGTEEANTIILAKKK